MSPEIVAHLSTFYHFQPGDVICTGTPEGVGPVKPGDKITGAVAGVTTIALTIGPPGWCRPKRVYVAPTFRSA